MSVAFVALGSNLGDRLLTVRSAIHSLSELGTVLAVSSIYETVPVGDEDQPRYLNAVAKLETTIRPEALLERLLAIEQTHGRERTFRNAPRTLDLDLLLHDEEMRESESLTLPHPRMHERAFVLVPLNEIAPETLVPGKRKSVSELLAELRPVSGVNLVTTV